MELMCLPIPSTRLVVHLDRGGGGSSAGAGGGGGGPLAHPAPLTLADLKQRLVQMTSIPYGQLKLIYQGLVLKDDGASLASYNIQNGSRLMLVGTRGGVPATGDMPGQKSSIYDQAGGAAGASGAVPRALTKGEELAMRKRQREEDVSEAGLMGRINEAVEGVRKELLPEVKEFVTTTTAAGKVPAEQKDKLALQHRKLSEFLLRALLTLDGIAVNTDETRKHRKAAVKEVQGHLDQVDEAWQHFKEASKGSVGESSIKS